MKSKVVAILETRTGARLAELIANRGGIPMLAPALEEVPVVEPSAVLALLDQSRTDPFNICIFQTGVGTRALFSAAESAGATARLKEMLAAATVVVRGPKPTAELNAREIRIDIRAASPFTTETVLDALSPMAIAGSKILVQRYGEPNQPLLKALEARGAAAREFATYRWALPADIEPLIKLLAALQGGHVDAVVFTSAVQMHHLYAVAARLGSASQLAAQLNRSVVASIGPVCSRTLRQYGVTPNLEADPPKLGPLMTALDNFLSAA